MPAKGRWRVLMLGLLLSSTAAAVPGPRPPVIEVADPTLDDFAQTLIEPGHRPVIRYNPVICARAGRALCVFTLWHELGHIVLRHASRHISLARKEREADIWAARHAPPAAVRAAYRFFLSGHGGSASHGSSLQRAARLRPFLLPPRRHI